MEILSFIIGAVMGGAVVFLVARNNQKKFNKALGIDPKAKLAVVLADLKGHLKNK